MRVLITGATGLIGSKVAEMLKTNCTEENFTVYCLARNTAHPTAGFLHRKYGCQIIKGDVRDESSLKNAFTLAEPEVIINCAGVLRGLETSSYYAVNRDAVLSISKLARDRNTKVVHISSLAAYGPALPGKPKQLPSSYNLADKNKPIPISDYGRSKLEGNIALVNSGARYTIVVPSAVYGPRDKDMFFFFKLASMGIAITTARRRTIQLSYIEDVARVIIKCLKPDTDGNTYYTASPEEYNWLDIFQIIGTSVNKKIRLKLTLPEFLITTSAVLSEKFTAILWKKPAVFNRDKAREMLAPAWIASGSDITEKELGIKFTNFAEGALKTYNWYKENHWL